MKTFPETKLLVTDTDSFCYEITSEKDIYDVIKGNDLFDFSNYDEDHPLFDDSKKLKPGYFKDEFGGKIPLEVIGLRPKMYSILLWIGLVKSAAKGVNKTVRDVVITHQDFKDTLLQEMQRSDTMWRIYNKDHKLFTAQVKKKTLSPYDDKRYRTREGDEFSSYSFGHYMIDAMESQ